MATPDPTLAVLILAGGVGSRFWPASTPARPKQLLPLATGRPLLVDTWQRAEKLVPPERIHILTGPALADPFRKILPELPDSSLWIEPRARGTGPVLAWAAHRLARTDPGSIMVSLHADHSIAPVESMVRLLSRAARFASEADRLVTVAIPPTRPETGYGWIHPGETLAEEPAFRARAVEAFREKPDLETARRYMARGHLWNSGIFVWGAGAFLDEVRRRSPEIGPHLGRLDAGDVEGFFDAVEPISVDEAVLERSPRVATVEATFQWDDVGSWDSLARSAAPDPEGNAVRGRAAVIAARRNLVWAEDGPVILWGVEDLAVIRSGGVTVVAPRERTPQWKDLLKNLPDSILEFADRHHETRSDPGTAPEPPDSNGPRS